MQFAGDSAVYLPDVAPAARIRTEARLANGPPNRRSTRCIGLCRAGSCRVSTVNPGPGCSGPVPDSVGYQHGSPRHHPPPQQRQQRQPGSRPRQAHAGQPRSVLRACPAHQPPGRTTSHPLVLWPLDTTRCALTDTRLSLPRQRTYVPYCTPFSSLLQRSYTLY